MLVANSYPEEEMGGAEYQTYLISKGLAESDHEVVFVAAAASEEAESRAGSITVRKVPSRDVVGWAGHRRALARALREKSPAICYVRAFLELDPIVPFCKENGIKVVSTSSHLKETSPLMLGYTPLQALASLRSFKTMWHLRSFLTIRSAHVHICNTKSLEKSIRRWYREIPVRTIYNGSPIPPKREMHLTSSGQVLWVNNVRPFKRPEVFVELARRLPQYQFLMVGRMPGSKRNGRRFRVLINHAPPNFRYLGPKPIKEVNALISQSDLLVYTSLPVEGFANSFIQAWVRGVPTVSLEFDLDGILESQRVGRCSQSFEQLVFDVDELMNDEKTRLEMGRLARNYAVRRHDPERMVAEYEALFNGIA